jgi:16S rRNA (guanine527-N7)-methyltransferase
MSYDQSDAALQTSMVSHLRAAMADLPGPIDEPTLAKMASHWAMVRQWTQQVNLTAIADDAEAAWLHYRDALEVLPMLQEGPTLDIGSGGGFPGIPLALARPTWPFALMEPRRKRASLLTVAAGRLGLRHVTVLGVRLDAPPTRAFAQAVTRATFSDLRALGDAGAWLAPGGRLYAFRSGHAELDSAAVAHLGALGLRYDGAHSYAVRDVPRRVDAWTRQADVRHSPT